MEATDVVALKCIYFQLVKSLKEIDWYGINCNVNDYINDIELAFTYLQILEHGCELSHRFQCEIKTFITKKSSFCLFTDSRCSSKYTIIQLELFLSTENNFLLITEDSKNILTDTLTVI